MDKSFRLHGIEFEWDAQKYSLNVRKHGIKFEEAAEVFFDLESNMVMHPQHLMFAIS